jgi:hypothetical protein
MLPQVVCPVAKQLSAKQPVLLHFASSTDMYTLMPKGASRINAPAELCQGPNITWIARIGSMTYGGESTGRGLLLLCSTAVAQLQSSVISMNPWYQ